MPRHRYYLKNGDQVPGVTTVISLLDKPALLNWAWQCGMDGVDFRQVRDTAADIGSLAHLFIKTHLSGQKIAELDTSEYSQVEIEKATAILKLYKSWFSNRKREVLLSEQPLVSEYWEFGGTPDQVIREGRDVCLDDCKTSKFIYPEMWYQLAAYNILWNEKYPDLPITRWRILRFDKNGDGLEIQIRIAQNQGDTDIFLHLLGIYKILWKRKYGTLKTE